MFSVKLQLIVILFCCEVYSKVFLNPKGAFCIINVVPMKKQTLMACISLGGDFDEVRENERQIRK